MLETIKNGGILMIPIILCGIFALFIIFERIVFFMSTAARDRKLVNKVIDNLDVMDFSAAEAECVKAATPLASVLRTAVHNRRLDEDHLKELVQVEMDAASSKYEKFLTILGTIGNVATMLGLLGTVTGNIRAFGVLGNGGTMGDPAALANAIAEALVTTVGGLCVAIPSILFHAYFNTVVNKKLNALESASTKVMFNIIGKDV